MDGNHGSPPIAQAGEFCDTKHTLIARTACGDDVKTNARREKIASLAARAARALEAAAQAVGVRGESSHATELPMAMITQPVPVVSRTEEMVDHRLLQPLIPAAITAATAAWMLTPLFCHAPDGKKRGG